MMALRLSILPKGITQVPGSLRSGLAALGPLARVQRVGLAALALALLGALAGAALPGILIPLASLAGFLGLVAFSARTLWALWPREGRLARVRRRYRVPVLAAVLLLGGWIPHLLALLLAVGLGLFTVGAFDAAARYVSARAEAWGARRPLLFGWALFGGLVLLFSASGLLFLAARLTDRVGLYGHVVAALAAASTALLGVTLWVGALGVTASVGAGREALPRRATYAAAFFVPVAAYYGFVVASLTTQDIPFWAALLVLGLTFARVGRILYLVGRRAADRFLPPGTTWDLLLALAFSSVYVYLAGSYGDALLGMKALRATSIVGLLLGAVAFPFLPRLRRLRARWRRAGAATTPTRGRGPHPRP